MAFAVPGIWEGDGHESRVTLRCGPSCRNLADCIGEGRSQMLCYYVAYAFGRAVLKTRSQELRRMPVDGKEKWPQPL